MCQSRLLTALPRLLPVSFSACRVSRPPFPGGLQPPEGSPWPCHLPHSIPTPRFLGPCTYCSLPGRPPLRSTPGHSGSPGPHTFPPQRLLVPLHRAQVPATSRAEEEPPLPLMGDQLLLPASSPPGPRRPSTSALPSAAGRGGSHQGPVEGRPEPSLKGALRVARGGPGKEDRQGLGQHVHSLKAGSGPHRGHQPVPGALWQLLSAAAAQLYRFSVPKLLLKSGGTAANSGRLGFYLVILNCHLVNRHWFCIY